MCAVIDSYSHYCYYLDQRGCVLPNVRLLAASHKNYRSDLHEDFITDVCFDKEVLSNFRSYPDLDSKSDQIHLGVL